MFLYTITTYPNEKQNNDEYERFIEEQEWFLAALSKNGQILAYGCHTVFSGVEFINYVLVPEEDSLEMKFNNVYVNECYESINKLSNNFPVIKNLGKSTDYDDSCICKSPKSYFLHTGIWQHASPIICRDCEKNVPLYKLPKILNELEYYSVLSWQKAYKAFDRLYFEGYNERVAINRMCKYNSNISIMGRKICSCFEEKVGKPFYFYLYNHKKIESCPSCGSKWKYDGKMKKMFCEKCRLLTE